MEQHLTVSGDIPPACDLCHSRKVKCDRRSPCANCTDARVECRRLRRRRSPRKGYMPSRLTHRENIVNLERSISRAENQTTTTELLGVSGRIPTNSGDHDGSPDRSVREPSPTSTVSSVAGANGSNYHAVQAKDIIRFELDDDRGICPERQPILKSALGLVSQIAKTERQQSYTVVEHEAAFEDPSIPVPEAPPRELLFMLLRDPSQSVCFQWPDHISDKAFERMASTLLRGDLGPDGLRFNQYCVCIYVKAIFYIYQVSRATEDPIVKSQLLQSRTAYIAAAIRSIKRFNILARPDLSGIQSLISSALLMQHLGNINQCRLLNSYAANQIVSLNYHRIRKALVPSESERDIYSVVYWCFYLDRTLSSLLGQPPSLPDPGVSPTDLITLDPSSPYNTLLRVLLDLAQIQGRLHTISGPGKYTTRSEILESCQLLGSQMASILPNLEPDRSPLPYPVQGSWVAVDFCYYAIFVEIHRTRLQALFSPLVHKECLLCARKSLRAFHSLQQRRAEMPGFDDPYPSFLTWTLFFYPLSPFFVLFCNIIAKLDREDYNLMRTITQALSQFKQHPHIEKLLNLIQALERLCDPLFQDQSGQRPATEGIPPRPSDSGGAIYFPDSVQTADVSNNNIQLGNDFALGMDVDADSSVDWLMWQLFNSQVPAGWPGLDAASFDIS